MRKLLFLLSIFTIVLSCSSDETSTPVTPPPAVPIEEASLRVSLNESLESVNTLIKPQIQELLDELNQLKENYLSKKINQQVFISSMSQIEVKLDDIYFENNIMEDGIYYHSYKYINRQGINNPSVFEEISDKNYSSDIYMGYDLPLDISCKEKEINRCIEVKNGIPVKYGFKHAGKIKYFDLDIVDTDTGCGIHWIPFNDFEGLREASAKGKGFVYFLADNRLPSGYEHPAEIWLMELLSNEIVIPRIEDVQEEDEFWGDEVYKDIDWNDPVSYVMAFLKDAERHGVDLSFVDTESIIAEVVDNLPSNNTLFTAASYASNDKTKVDIKFSKSHWDSFSYFNKNNKRIVTMWHELGHDILQLEHNNTNENFEEYDLMRTIDVAINMGDWRGFKYFQKAVDRMFSGEGQIKMTFDSNGNRIVLCQQ